MNHRPRPLPFPSLPGFPEGGRLRNPCAPFKGIKGRPLSSAPVLHSETRLESITFTSQQGSSLSFSHFPPYLDKRLGHKSHSFLKFKIGQRPVVYPSTDASNVVHRKSRAMRPKVLEISYVSGLACVWGWSDSCPQHRWHETQAVYSCDFQALPAAQLKRLLPLANDEEDGKAAEKGPIIAGGRQFRLATAGGDSKVRVSLHTPTLRALPRS